MAICGKKLNKRGSLQDILLIGLVGLAFAIIMLFGFKIADSINTEIQGMASIPTEAKTASTTLNGYYPSLMDNMFIFLVFGLSIGAIVLASLVRVHPVFIALYIIALIIVIILCAMLSNVYQEMAANAELASLASQMVKMDLILTYWPFIIGILGSLIAIIMYKQWQND